MIARAGSIDALRASFQWDIPHWYNMGVDVCDRIAAKHPDRAAIIDIADDGAACICTFAQLKSRSDRMAHVVDGLTRKGDRVAVLLPQSADCAAAYIAIMKSGRIAQPLFTLFGPDALSFRLGDAGTVAVVTDRAGAAKLAALAPDLPDLKHVLCVDGLVDGLAAGSTTKSAAGVVDLEAACKQVPDRFPPVRTLAEDPALLIYTSGTTGNPKGALHAHRVLLGHLPGVEMSHDFFPQKDDRIWTPADWAWIGGLLDVLMPALHHGVPVVARRFGKFTGEAAFDLIAQHDVRNVFLPPTALRMLRAVAQPQRWRLHLRSVASGGEALGPDLIAWGRDVLGVTINEFYGQTECNMIVSSCGAIAPPEEGAMGFAVPGHDVAVLTPEGAVCATGQEGEITVRAPDPVMFLGYWNNPEATAEKFFETHGERWLRTGDNGRLTPDGRLAFIGRDDDIISSSGYRIGPGEIEDCLHSHPAVLRAGVVGKPDATRGEIVVAFVQLEAGQVPCDALAEAIRDHVRERLAAYEFPRRVVFTDTMPLTTTGKLIRATLRSRAALL